MRKAAPCSFARSRIAAKVTRGRSYRVLTLPRSMNTTRSRRRWSAGDGAFDAGHCGASARGLQVKDDVQLQAGGELSAERVVGGVDERERRGLDVDGPGQARP